MDVEVLVVGSVNEDVAVSVERLPGPGETLLASDLAISCGGKGANQAVAAARDGVRVAMAGAVGDDEAGRRQAAALDAAGVDTRWLPRLAGVPTGTAFIQVDTRGENTIVVAQGANARAALPAGDVDAPILVVSQFTLFASTRKGRRPGWSKAAPGSVSEPVIEALASELEALGATVERGRFGADMQVASVNDGPVTILIDTAAWE